MKALHKKFFWAFLWQYLSLQNDNVTQVVFVAAIIENGWQSSWILIRLLRNNIYRNEFTKTPNNIYMYS